MDEPKQPKRPVAKAPRAPAMPGRSKSTAKESAGSRIDDDCAPKRCAPDPCAPQRPLSRVIEREWIFGPCEPRDRDCDDDDGSDFCGGGGTGDGGSGHDGSGRNGGGDRPNPKRPTRPAGKTTGRLNDGGPLNKGDIDRPNRPGIFVGSRADMDLPYLFMRANAADLGKRPIQNAPFWESPDIFLLAGVAPAMAPPIPPQLGQVALAGEPNTLYAHVWNLGKAAANEVIVEFYWCDPSLGVTANSVHLIAQVTTSLGHKGSGHCHRLVKCPEPWSPTFLNGGHECLLVRIWDNPSDFPGEPKFDASTNRHVAQRNIHVEAPHAGPMPLLLHPAAPLIRPAFQKPLMIKVGNLYGAPAQVEVARVMPNAMPWLQLRTGVRGTFPAAAPPTGMPMLSSPVEGGAGFPPGGAQTQHVAGDDQVVAFSTSDHAPGRGEAHVYRVSAHQGGAVFGGYTVVVLG